MKRGNEEAFLRFHALFYLRLLRYFLVLTNGDEETSKDHLQNLYLKVVKGIRVFETEQQLWAWLTVLARNQVIDASRKRSTWEKFLDRFRTAAETTPESSPEDHWAERLEQALISLPIEGQRC
jgi:DNA-directed RNA polymerase specialized sigma24 family protein